jgi:ribosomal protein L33
MAKKNTILVRLTSTGLNANGKITGTFFVKKRNPKQQPEKISFRKYDSKAVSDGDGNNKREDGKAGIHVLFVEKKMPNPKAS